MTPITQRGKTRCFVKLPRAQRHPFTDSQAEGTTMATPADKRSHPRVKCSVNVQVMDASGGSTMLLTDDWSMTGVFLRTRTPATLGSVVGLTFVLRPYGRQQVQGIVVRSESGSGSGARAGQGVQFIGPPPEGLACFLRDSTRVAPSLRRPECKAA